MKNLELYSGLITGGLGTAYNLYQGDSLPSALAQGAIVGGLVGGGMYGGNKLYNTKIFNELSYRPDNNGLISLENKLDGYLHPDPYTKYRSHEELLDEALDDIRLEIELNYGSLNEDELESLKDTLEQTRIADGYYYLKEYNDVNRKNTDNIMNNIMPKVVYGTGAGTGLIGGTVANNILFQDKSEREQAQLLSELELLKANGSISPYLDDYLMRNS